MDYSSDIFLSYSHADYDNAERLAAAFETRGWSVWWDRRITPGKRFDEAISHALQTSRCVVVIWSESSLGSDWVIEEANEGKRRGILVPCLIEDVSPPIGFSRIQAADLMRWNSDQNDPGFLQLCEAITAVLDTASDTKSVSLGSNSGWRTKHPSRSAWAVLGALTITVCAMASLLYFILGRGGNSPPSASESESDSTLGATISGTIYYGEDPIAQHSKAPARISLMNIETREAVSVNVEYDVNNGQFHLRSVPTGKFSPFVRIESGYPFSKESGGDFYSRLTGLNDDIEIPPNTVALRRDLKVVSVVHLTRPFDNQQRNSSVYDPPPVLYRGAFAPSTRSFKWDPVPNATHYVVRFTLVENKGENGVPKPKQLADQSYRVKMTELSPDLNVTEEGQYYAFSLLAYDDERIVGNYVHYFKDGNGWLGFTVRERPKGESDQP